MGMLKRVMADGAKSSPDPWTLIANFVSLAYAIGANLVAIPIYIRSLGAEAYGLIGFYALLAAGFQVFDVGLSATMARECARFRGGALGGVTLWRLLNGLEIIFVSVGVVSTAALIASASWIATHWLKFETLNASIVSRALYFLAFAIPFQLVTGLYKSIQIGFEKQVLLAGLNILFATARFFGVLVALSVFGVSIEIFFGYQAILALVELVIFAEFGRSMMPVGRKRLSFAVTDELGRVLKFASSIGVVTICWIIITQADRFILSNLLTMKNYGVFTLAATASSALVTMSSPFGQTLLPRLTMLNARGQLAGALKLYRHSTQLSVVVALPAALVLALFARQVLWIWTGDWHLAERAAPILSAYAIGSGIVPLTAFTYYLQYSHGDLRLHIVGQALMAAIFLPGVFFTARAFGPVGVGYLWTTINIVYLLVWSAVVHHKFSPGLHWSWLKHDIFAIFMPAAILGVGFYFVWKVPGDRLTALVELVVASLGIVGAAAAASPFVRKWVRIATRKIVDGGSSV